MRWRGVIERYREFLPVSDSTPIITLNEGNTPLIRLERFVELLGVGLELYVKYEGVNPTGSFKDRGMTLAVSKAVEAGSKAVICASTGNTSASAAAYAARANLRSILVIPEGKIAQGKFVQALIHQATVIQVKGSFDDALGIVLELARRYPITLVNSLNPHRIEGQKTGAFEVCDQLGGVPPAYHILPVGNAGNITAYWRGYTEYAEAGRISHTPVMMGFQAEGAAPIVRGQVVERPETVATAIRIGNPANWSDAVRAVEDSGGLIDMVSDEEIVEAYRLIASLEGIFCEPASAAGLAGILKYASKGYFRDGDVVVCTLTGHGLKDPDLARAVSVEPRTVLADVDAVAEALQL
jgi:threonine synthase